MIKKYNQIIQLLVHEYISYNRYSNVNNVKYIHVFNDLVRFTNKIENTGEIPIGYRKVFLNYIDILSNELSRRGCNDFTFPDNFTLSERRKIMKEMHELNGDPEEYEPNDEYKMTMDFIILFYIKKKYEQYFKHLETIKLLKQF